MEKVSIILPVYNSEFTILKSIESVLNQSYENIELIIINDGSTDETDNICKEIAYMNQEKIKYISVENGGVSKARNLGLNCASGKYIMFIDSDDEFLPEMIENMVNFLEINDYELVTCGYKRVNLNSDKEEKSKKLENNIEKNGKENYQKYIEDLQNNNMFNQLWNKIYLKNIIDENNIKFDETLLYAEDLEFNLKYIDKIEKAGILNELLYKYTNTINGLNLNYKENKLEINLKMYYLKENLYYKNDFKLSSLDKLYIKACLSGLKNIELCKDLIKKDKKLDEFINNIEIHNKLNEIKKNTNFLNKLIIFIMNIKNKMMLKLFLKIINIVDKINKKIKLGY